MLPSQSSCGSYGFVNTASGRLQIQMDLTAAELAKSAFLCLANVHSAAQLQFIWTTTFVPKLDLKMKNGHSCSAGIQELIFHSEALTPAPPPATALPTDAPATPERSSDKRKVEVDAELTKLRKELKAAESARDHQTRTCDSMKAARDRRGAGKGGGKGGGGGYNNWYNSPPPYYQQGGYQQHQNNNHPNDSHGGRGGGRN